MSKHMTRAGMLLLLSAIPAAAQDSGPTPLATIIQAMQLPTQAKQSRALGVPESDLSAILTHARQNQVPAATISDLLWQENDAIRKHGRIDNFGSFVQSKLDQGLRGKELAAAIHAEHAARGMGKGNGKGEGKMKSGMKGGMPDMPDKPGMKGRKPESPGQSGKKGGGR